MIGKGKRSVRFGAHLALVAANILLGLNFSVFVSVVRNYMGFQTLFFLRVLFTALCCAPWVLTGGRYRITVRDFIGILLPTVLVLYGHEFMMLWAAEYTNPVESSTISTLAPVITLSVSARMFREKIHAAKVVGVILGFSGAALLIFRAGLPAVRSEEIGNLMMLVSVAAAATNTVFIKNELVRYGTMAVTGWYYIIGLVFSAPFFAGDLLRYDFTGLPAVGWLEIVYILVPGTLLPAYLLYYGTEKLTSVHTGLYAYLQPVTATVFAVFRGQVTLDAGNLFSAALIFTGIVLVVLTYVRFKFPSPGN